MTQSNFWQTKSTKATKKWYLTSSVITQKVRSVFDDVTFGGALVNMGPTAFWAPTKYLCFEAYSPKKHDLMYHYWNLTITDHLWWAKTGFFLYFSIFFPFIWSFSSGLWAWQDSRPDTCPPPKYALAKGIPKYLSITKDRKSLKYLFAKLRVCSLNIGKQIFLTFQTIGNLLPQRFEQSIQFGFGEGSIRARYGAICGQRLRWYRRKTLSVTWIWFLSVSNGWCIITPLNGYISNIGKFMYVNREGSSKEESKGKLATPPAPKNPVPWGRFPSCLNWRWDR